MHDPNEKPEAEAEVKPEPGDPGTPGTAEADDVAGRDEPDAGGTDENQPAPESGPEESTDA